MKILFDQGTPAPLRNALAAHTISTAYEMGWSDLENGELLKRAEEMFDAFITTDKNLRYQQNLDIDGWRFSSCLRQVGSRSMPI
jgi:hypothetical protein